MCLDNTKQGFVLLEAFRQAGPLGLDWDSMVEKMEELSIERFGSDRYVRSPGPLLSVLGDAIEASELELGENDYWRITEFGQSVTKIIDENFVSKSFPAP